MLFLNSPFTVEFYTRRHGARFHHPTLLYRITILLWGYRSFSLHCLRKTGCFLGLRFEQAGFKPDTLWMLPVARAVPFVDYAPKLKIMKATPAGKLSPPAYYQKSSRGQNPRLRGPSFVHDRIAQDPYSFHPDFHYVACHYRSHTFRGPGRDQISRKQSHKLTDVTNDDIERKDEVARRALLPNLAIYAGFDRHSRPGIEVRRHQRPHRTERVEALAPGPLPILLLQVARSEVVHCRVTQDVGSHVVVRAQLMAGAAHYHAQFSLVVRALGNLGTHDVLSRPQQLGLGQRYRLDPLGSRILEISTALWGGHEQARDLLMTGNRFHQPVAGLALELKLAIFHASSHPLRRCSRPLRIRSIVSTIGFLSSSVLCFIVKNRRMQLAKPSRTGNHFDLDNRDSLNCEAEGLQEPLRLGPKPRPRRSNSARCPSFPGLRTWAGRGSAGARPIKQGWSSGSDQPAQGS